LVEIPFYQCVSLSQIGNPIVDALSSGRILSFK
jgi:hypothetical protein